MIGVKATILPGTTWANEMNIVMNRAPGAGSITQPVDHQSRALQLSYEFSPSYLFK